MRADKTAFCRFDTNIYSVAPEHGGRTLTFAVDDREARLLDSSALLVSHARCWGRRQTVEAPEHRQALLAQKAGAREHRTNLAQALGMAALQQGRTVRFTTLAAALADLSRQESAPALERRLRRYTSVDLLVLDELGYLPCDGPSADLLRTFAACPMGAPGSTASRQPRAPPVDAAGVHCAFPARRSRQVSVHAETLRQRRQEGAP